MSVCVRERGGERWGGGGWGALGGLSNVCE